MRIHIGRIVLMGFCLPVFLSTAPAEAVIIHVPVDYPTIQGALDAAVNGDTVLVADGTYTGAGNVDLNFNGREIGLASENGAANCVIDCQQTCRALTFNSGETSVVVQGFTFTNGSEGDGGAMLIQDSSPTVEQCIFENNAASDGGAVMITGGSDPVIVQSEFTANSATGGGGAICSDSATGFALEGCSFTGNTAEMGGAIDVFDSSAVILNSSFDSNSASSYGGAINSSYCDPVIGGSSGTGNSFNGNHAGFGLGADIFCYQTDAGVNAAYNSFSGIAESPFYVGPLGVFDLTGCSSGLTPITQDVYVSPTGDDANDGLTSGTPFQTIRYALSRILATEGHPITVHLAAGTYSSSETGELFPVPLIDHVTIQGMGIFTTSLNGEAAHSILYGSCAGNSAWTDTEFTHGAAEFAGGALEMDETAVSFTRCRFKSNESKWGGAITCWYTCDLTLTDCVFENNTATSGYGGAIHQLMGSLTMTGCVLNHNDSRSGGGALNLLGMDSVMITQCSFGANSSRVGGAISATNPEILSIHNTGFDQCTAVIGGAIHLYSSAGNTNDITLCTFSGNTAERAGGAVYFDHLDGSLVIGGSPAAANSFSGNFAPGGCDIYMDADPAVPVNAMCNQFETYPLSDYSVTPPGSFDLTDCQSTLAPITQDVYVAADGDDTRDGLSWSTAFKTLAFAVSRIYGTAEQPVTIHIGPGVFTPSGTGERFPVPLVSHVTIQGAGLDATSIGSGSPISAIWAVKDSGISIRDINIFGTSEEEFPAVTIEQSGAELNAVRIGPGTGSGMDIDGSSVLLMDTQVVKNVGGGIRLANNTELIAVNSVISENQFGVNWGGGIRMTDSTAVLFNCLIAANENDAGMWGSAVRALDSSVTLHSSTTFNNVSYELFISDSVLTIRNSIVYGSDGEELKLDESTADIQYSNIKGGFAGTGNMDAPPMFVTGPMGTEYLSQTAAGQASDSPCVDAGSGNASEISYDVNGNTIYMDEYTTRTDQVTDTGIVDMGYHYAPSIPPTPTPSPAPLGVTIDLNREFFHPGDFFSLNVNLQNPGPETYTDQPFVLFLDVYSQYFWFPAWTETFTYLPVDLDVAVDRMHIFEFYWPDTDTSATGIRFYSALLTEDFSAILGVWDMAEFGWD